MLSGITMDYVFRAACDRQWDLVLEYARKGWIDFEKENPNDRRRLTIQNYTEAHAFYLVRRLLRDNLDPQIFTRLVRFIKFGLVRAEANHSSENFRDQITRLAFHYFKKGDVTFFMFLCERNMVNLDLMLSFNLDENFEKSGSLRFFEMLQKAAFDSAYKGRWDPIMILLSENLINIDALDSQNQSLLDIALEQRTHTLREKGHAPELDGICFLLKFNYQHFDCPPARTFTPSLDGSSSSDSLEGDVAAGREMSESPLPVFRCVPQ